MINKLKKSSLANIYRKLRFHAFSVKDYISSYLFDIFRYVYYTRNFGKYKDENSARSFLLMTIHALEKGLVLPEKRPGFGREKIQILLKDIIVFHNKFGYDPVCAYLLEVVGHVLEHHRKTNTLDQGLETEYESVKKYIFSNGNNYDRKGGAILINSNELKHYLPANPRMFFETRHSVRQFALGAVSDSVIMEACRIAQTSPSVCNRQSGRMYYTSEKKLIDEMLYIQGGAAGFSSCVYTLVVVTSDIVAFSQAGERNQSYVDGGIFSMTLALAFHSLGYGACYLNWSAPLRKDKKLRSLVSIPTNEVIITFLAVGKMLDTFEVAASPRVPIESVLRKIQSNN